MTCGVTAEQLLADIASSFLAVQRPDPQVEDVSDTADISLLDVESDLPLTFALDLQLLPLQPRMKIDNSCAAFVLSLIGL